MFRLALLALLLGSGPALAEGCRMQELRFAPGTSAAQVEDGAAPREFICYTLTARAGQQMSASVTAAEQNAVFQIYAPGWRNTREGGPEGQALPGTAPGEDATRFSGALPANGRYLIVVGATRGGTSFRLSVGIR